MNTSRRRFYALAPNPLGQRRSVYFQASYVRKRDVMLRRYATIVVIFFTTLFLLLLCSSEEEYLMLGDASVSERVTIQKMVPNITFSPGVLRGGVSLVSACQDNHEALRVTIPFWASVKAINEIILVDWSSNPSLRFVVEEVDNLHAEDPPVYVIQVQNQTEWHPSRAFNVGIRAAHFSQVIKVDCDHKVREDFVGNHPLPKQAFFAGSKHLERGSFDENLSGTLFIAKKDFLRNGGYDERIPDYLAGHEDLLERLQKNKLKRIDIDYDTLLHTSGGFRDNISSNHRPGNASEDIERSVNLELLRHLPAWTAYMGWKSFNANVNMSTLLQSSTSSYSHSNVLYSSVHIGTNISSIRALSGKDQIGRAREHVLNRILNSEFQLPNELLRALPSPCRIRLVQLLRDKNNNLDEGNAARVLFLHCLGEFLQRIHCLASGFSFAEKTGFIPVLVWPSEPGAASSALSNLFEDTSKVIVVGAFETDWSPWVFFAHTNNSKSISFQDMTNASAAGTVSFTSKKMMLHTYVTAQGALTSEITRHTSDHAMHKTLGQFEISAPIRKDLQDLEDRGLSSAVGIYIPSEFGQSNKKERDAFLAEMRRRYDEFTKWDTRPTKVYVDGNTRMQGFLRDEFSTLLLAPREEMNCERMASVCEKSILTRAYALAKTARFWYPELTVDSKESHFVSLIRILRGDSFSW